MMRHTRVVVAVAALAWTITALASANAMAAAPEYGRCVKVAKNSKGEYTGKFSEAKCLKEVPASERAKKGKYEWEPGLGKRKFTSSGGAGLLETVKGSTVSCEAESSGGEFKPGNNKEEADVIVKFTGCKTLSLQCTSPGDKPGELTTNELEGIIGWEKKATKKTDLELYPAKSVASGLFIEFSCSGVVIQVRGKVLVPIKNDAMKETETLKFKATKGKQKPEKWEESSEPAILESSFSNISQSEFEQAGQTITSTVKGEEKAELNAVV